MKGGSSLSRAQSGIPTGGAQRSGFANLGPPPPSALPLATNASPFVFKFPDVPHPNAAHGESTFAAPPWSSSSFAPTSLPAPSTASPTSVNFSSSPSTALHANPDQAWEPTFKKDAKPDDPFSILLRTLTSILNKIGPKNFESLVRELVEHLQGRCVHDGKRGLCGEGLKDPQNVALFAHTIYERALDDPSFSDIYSLVCRVIDPFCPELEKQGGAQTFQECLVDFCEAEVDDYFEEEDTNDHQGSTEGDETDDEGEDGKGDGKKSERKRRLKNSLKFAAELYNSGMMATINILQTADFLSEQADSIEFCCHLLRYAGQTMDIKTEEAIKLNKVEPPYTHSLEEAVHCHKYIDRIYENLESALAAHELSPRVSFMVQDLLEERDNNWQKPAPSAAQPSTPAGPPRKPPITVRRSLNRQSTTGTTLPQPSSANPTPSFSSTSPSSTGVTTLSSSASPAPSFRPDSSSYPSNASSQPAPTSTNTAAKPIAATDPAAIAMAAAKREQVRHIANAIVKPLRDAIQWADDMERRLEAEGQRTPIRVEEINRVFLTQLKDNLNRLHKQLGDVPFLVGLLNTFNAYMRDSKNIAADPAMAERAPFDPNNIRGFKSVILGRIAKVEQMFHSSANPATGSNAHHSTPPRTATSPPKQSSPSSSIPSFSFPTPGDNSAPEKPLALAPSNPTPSSTSRTAQAASPWPPQERPVPASLSSAPSKPVSDELPAGWTDPDLHKLTRGQSLTKVLHGWEEELATHFSAVNRNAQLVASMDKVSRSVDFALTGMTRTINQVAIAQTEMDKGLDVIFKHQLELDSRLAELESQARDMLPREDADLLREKSYATAKQLGRDFKEAEHGLRNLVESFNTSLTLKHSAQEQQVRELEEVLNHSLNALQWMDATSGMLERKLRKLRSTQHTSGA